MHRLLSSISDKTDNIQRQKGIHLLPDEILLIILRLAIVQCEVLYHTCTSVSFPWVEHACINDIFEHLPRWTHLRLVCRNWARILHLTDNPFGPKFGNTDVLWTPRVEVDWGDTSFHVRNPILIKIRNNKCAMSDKMLRLLFAESNIMNSTSTLQIYERRGGEAGSDGDSAVKHVLDNIHFFPKVKSLTVVTFATDVPNFWKRLQHGFNRLTALFLTMHEPIPGTGRLELNELEVLRLNIQSPLECCFPSLKHCSIDARTSSNTHLYDQLLQDHGTQLVSVILLGYPSSYFDSDDFWIRYPNLQLVGLSDDNASTLQGPPTHRNPDQGEDQEHPFNHLYIDIGLMFSVERLTALVDLVRVFRKSLNLRRFSVAYENLSSKGWFNSAFQNVCLEQGVEYRVIE